MMVTCPKCVYQRIQGDKKCFRYADRYTEQGKMTGHIKEPHVAIFTVLTGYRKSYLDLDLIEK